MSDEDTLARRQWIQELYWKVFRQTSGNPELNESNLLETVGVQVAEWGGKLAELLKKLNMKVREIDTMTVREFGILLEDVLLALTLQLPHFESSEKRPLHEDE